MSTTEGLYTAVQRRTINQILKLATTDDKGKIVKAFNLAEKLTPEAHKGEINFVRDKIIDDHPALQHRQARRRSAEPARSRSLHRVLRDQHHAARLGQALRSSASARACRRPSRS